VMLGGEGGHGSSDKEAFRDNLQAFPMGRGGVATRWLGVRTLWNSCVTNETKEVLFADVREKRR
jgi:hypothetical protein